MREDKTPLEYPIHEDPASPGRRHSHVPRMLVHPAQFSGPWEVATCFANAEMLSPHVLFNGIRRSFSGHFPRTLVLVGFVSPDGSEQPANGVGSYKTIILVDDVTRSPEYELLSNYY